MQNSKVLGLKNPIIVALDVDEAEECFKLALLLKDHVGAFKIGPRLAMRFGAPIVSELAKLAPVFVDNKYLDIPSTVDAAIRATFDAGATLATVHAWNGPETLAQLAKTEIALAKKRPFKILSVTILTSFNDQTLPPGFARPPEQSIEKSVENLAKMTLESGLTGLVCSPHEVESLRSLDQNAFLVTPGVRMADALGGDDQKRVETPANAIKKGASALVIGRPILAAKDPQKEVARILATLEIQGATPR